MSRKYQVLPATAPVPAPDDYLEQLVQRGAQKMLQDAVEQEVDEFLGRHRYERKGVFRGYRNGHHKPRSIGVGMSAVEVCMPRVSDVPAEVSSEGFRSEIVGRYERRSRTQARLLVRLYLEGLASGDFEPIFRALVGETAALSPQSIGRLKAEWKQEFENWQRRPLKKRYLYLFADGFYIRAGREREKTATLTVLGVDENGQKELLAMEHGYRESMASWAAVLRSLKDRGLIEDPLLLIGDGALGIWSALGEVFPSTRRARCWNHRALNILDKLPKRLWQQARARLRELATAPDRAECERLRDQLCHHWRAIGQSPAADCLERDWEDFVTFYDFPQEHWLHLRTTNPIESIFAGVRLRTNASKRMGVRENALYLIFKLILRLGLNWRAINAPNQLQLLLQGHRFQNGSHSPIFQIMFTLEHEPVVSTNRAGLTLKPVLWINNTAKFDLSLTLVEDGTHLQGNFDYSTDLFTAETISRLTHHFQTLLESIVTNPDQPLSQLALLSPAEQQQLLHAWQQPVHPATEVRCFHRLFEEQVQRTPKALAVTDGDQRYTYQEVNTRANQLAHYLRTLGVGPEVRVGLCLERSLEMLVSLLGILKAGGAYVPLDPTAPRERLAFLAQDADLALILCQQQLQEQFSGVAPRLACVDGAWDTIAQNSQENLTGEASGENLVYVMYTSGSTGTPKGVMITQRGLSNYLRWAVNAYQGEQGRGAPVHSALTFDLTITSLLVPLLSGQTVVLVPETAGEMFPLGRVLHEGGFSLVKLTPAHLELLAHTLPAEAAAGMATRLVIGGEALNGEGLAFWRTHAPATRIVNEYGPTETVVGCCVFEQAAGDSKPGPVPIGRPIANMQVYVLDSELGPAPIGVPGEIYIGGVGVARGYLGRPDLTAERFIPHPFASEPGVRLYRTGDLARYRADGELEYLGRNDQQVKVRGFRIEPGEIEAALTRHAGVREALVVALEERAGDKRLVAYLVADGQKDVLPANEQVRQHLQTLLPDYMIPAAYVWLEELPLTAHGKIDRAALPAPDWASQATTTYVAPRTSTEESLASLWAQLLRCERVGVHDNFFELGGHSLLATRLIARVSETFRLSLPLRTLFEAPTLASFAARLEQQRDAGEEPEEVPLVRGGRYNILAQKPSESH